MRDIGSRRHLGIVVILLVAGFVAMNLINYNVSLKSLRTEIARNELPLTGDTIYSEIQRDLMRPIFISSVMAQDTFLRDWVLDGEKDPEKITRYLAEIQRRYGTVTSFFVSEKTSNYYHPSGILKQVHPDQWRDAWYYRVRDMTEPYEINLDVDMANEDALTIFINYRTLDYSGRFIGATGVGLTVNAVTKLIDEYQDRYNRAIYFCDPSGYITLAGDSVVSGERLLKRRPGMAPVVDAILSGSAQGKTYYHRFERQGETVHVDSRFIPEFGWFLLVEQGEAAAIHAIRKTLVLNLTMGTAVALLIVVLIWLTIRRYEQRLEVAATTDSLTGIPNRLSFELAFSRRLKEKSGDDGESALLIIDIDHFKRVNDDYGHTVGDRVIQHVTTVIRQNIRTGDAFARWGGEEFIILLQGAGAERSHAQAERIRRAVRETPYIHESGEIPVSISIGVACCGFGDENSLFARADRALLRAKEEGRDRTVLAAD